MANLLKTPCGSWYHLSLDVSTNDSTTKGDTFNRHKNCAVWKRVTYVFPVCFVCLLCFLQLTLTLSFIHMINPYLHWQVLVLREQWETAGIWSSTDCTRDTKNDCVSKWEIKWKIYESLKSLPNLSVKRLGSQSQLTSWLEEITKCVSAIEEWACCPLNITVVLPITSKPVALSH